MLSKLTSALLISTVTFFGASSSFAQTSPFTWPEGKKTAISLSFDDARGSQATTGIPFLNQYKVKGTFYLVPSAVKGQLENWKKAVASGQEMANHSVNHACTGNFPWARKNALEDYTQEEMHAELIEANKQLYDLLGVKCEGFAYPCGNTFVGRGANTKSYVPVVADLFVTGRGWLDEGPNDPEFCDMAQLTGMEMDGKDFDKILPLITQVKKSGQWLILAGHEMGEDGPQTTRLSMLKKLIEYAQDPANGIWLAPVGEIAKYVQTSRSGNLPAPDHGVLVTPDAKGALSLHAQSGTAVGPKIKYMPEWKAFGWFTGEDRVEWEVNVTAKGTYDVEMEWSVSDEDAGKAFVLESGAQKLTGKVEPSRSWETFRWKKIGNIQLNAGKQKVVFRPATKFTKGALLDLREIRLVRVKE
jgi:peptidoglycan/xylan/chitin deacetylase (PgdA/CDA1 family)